MITSMLPIGKYVHTQHCSSFRINYYLAPRIESKLYCDSSSIKRDHK